MRILLAGATGVIGRQAVPVLTAAGHQVTGLANRPARLPGAEVMVADALDRAAVAGPPGSSPRGSPTPTTPPGQFAPVLAALRGAPAPGHVPAWLARLLVGGWGVAFMTSLAGASNLCARERLDWKPTYSGWRDGLAAERSVAPR